MAEFDIYNKNKLHHGTLSILRFHCLMVREVIQNANLVSYNNFIQGKKRPKSLEQFIYLKEMKVTGFI